MNFAENVSVITLVRLDDVPSRRSKLRLDARAFLEEYVRKLRKQASTKPECEIQSAFFILGRASVALLLSCPALSEVPKLIGFLSNVQDELRKEKAVNLGTFETFSFPSIEVRSSKLRYAHETKDKVIPALVFVRTTEDLTALFRRLSETSCSKLVSNLFAVYSGFGVYNVIFHLRFGTLYDLRDTLMLLRKNLGKFRETSTLIGVPSRKRRKKEESLAKSTPKIQFSISVKCAGDLLNAAKSIPNVSNKIQDVFFRQGYMDIEVPYSTKTVSDVFDLACKIRKVDGVTDTCTTVQILALAGARMKAKTC